MTLWSCLHMQSCSAGATIKLIISGGCLVADEKNLRPQGTSAGDPEPSQTGSAGQPGQGPQKPPLTPLQATVILLKRGRQDMLPRLRELLQDQPEVWRHAGDLAAHTRRSWIELIGGEDDLFKESMALFAEQQRENLAGEQPTQLEELLVERVIAHQLRVLYLEASESQNPQMEDSPLGEFRLKKQEIADRQLSRAVALLESIRALLARTKIAEQKMLVLSDQRNEKVKPATNGTAPRAAMPGINRINGHGGVEVLLGASAKNGE